MKIQFNSQTLPDCRKRHQAIKQKSYNVALLDRTSFGNDSFKTKVPEQQKALALAETLIDVEIKNNSDFFRVFNTGYKNNQKSSDFEGVKKYILEQITPVNVNYLKPLIDAKDDSERTRFTYGDIHDIIGKITHSTEQFVKPLLSCKGTNGKLVPSKTIKELMDRLHSLI